MSAVPQPGLCGELLRLMGWVGSCSFVHQRQSYATQPALKHLIKAGKWQCKLVCLSTLQKFIIHIQINTWSLQTLLTVFWQGNLGWYFCYMNACSQSRHSQCAWLIFFLNGTNKRCSHPTGFPVPPTLICSLQLSSNPTEVPHTPVTRAQSSL